MSNPTCTPDECQNKGPRGGLCKPCANAKALRSYYANLESRRAYNKAWREANYEYDKQRQRDWYKANTEYFENRYRANRETLLERKRQQRAANPGGESKHSREWRKRNPERWALRNRENQRRRRGEKPVSYTAIIAEHGMVCHLCGGDIAGLEDLHMDHVIPLARGGKHSAENIRPAHAVCNMRKGIKIVATELRAVLD